MYINERIKDIEDIQNGITVEHVVLYDKLRIFSCDGPARQFECGQQRGGHYRRFCGVMVSVLTWSVIDHGFEPQLHQTKGDKIGICCLLIVV
jgi:hypothetical protein